MAGLLIRDMENLMDINMFLDEYLHWEAERLYCPLILQEMFLHAAYSGRREVEQMVCWGCWHSLPRLDPQADASTVWSVGPCTSREKIRDLYHQVYKLGRLPRSWLCRPEWVGELTKDMVSSLKNAWGGKRMSCRGNGEGQNLLTLPLCKAEPHWGEGTWPKLSLPRWRKPIKGPWQPQSPWKKG